ncbi:MAG: TonB-dependent receptor family protein [Gammaproteobacteria bacterium]
MRKINHSLVAIGVSLVPMSSYGETLAGTEKEVITLPTVEVVGSAERLPEIAGSASILYEEELTSSRVFTVHEALRKVPGVNIRDEEGFAIRPNIGLRGLNPTRSTKVLLLEDGLPLTYAPYGDNASYYHPPIDRFERIEVLKGSEQILFGPQTIGGVINYITPTPPQEFGGRLALTGGNRDYFNGHLGLGGKGLLLDVLQKQGDGSRDNEELELTDVNLKGIFNWGTRHGLTLRANYYREDSDVTYTGITEAELRNFGFRYNPFDNDEFEVDRYALSATYRLEFAADAVLTTSLYGTHFSRDWWRQSSTTTDSQCGAAFTNARLAGATIAPDGCNSIQGRLRDYYTYGVEPRLEVRHRLFGIESEFKSGFRAHYETQDRQQENGTSPTARAGSVVEDNDRDVDAYSGFAQNRFLLGRWTLTPGVRVEHVINERTNNLTQASGEADLTEVLPAAGLTFSPVDNTTLFFGFHRGFAPPRTEDLINTPSGSSTATFTDVDAEKSWIYEVGVRSQPLSGLHLDATYFRNDFENLIAVGSIAGGSTPLSQGEALFEGLELFGRLDSQERFGTKGNIYFQTAYTYLPTAEQETPFIQVANGQPVVGSQAGNRQPYAPEHLVTAAVGYTHTSGWDVRFEAVYVGDQFADFAETLTPSADGQRGLIEDYTIFNAAFNYPLKAWGTTLFLTAKNIADNDYIADRTRGIRPGSPLVVQGGVEFRF